MNSDIQDIENLFVAIKDGDKWAFEQVFKMFYAPLCDYAVMILGNPSEAEDVVQDLFTHIWKNRSEVIVHGFVKSYLFTSVRFRAVNVLRYRLMQRKHSELFTEFVEDLLSSGYSEEEEKRIERIMQVLQTLPPQRRIVFTMSCLDGKKYKEIAEELGISVNTVKAHISQAYRDVRQQVGEDFSLALLFMVLMQEKF